MPVIALVSAKSCGVTCSALALTLASPRPSVLVEADPSGGTVRLGYLAGAGSATVGLFALASADRQGTLASEFPQHLVALDRDRSGTRLLLPGLTDPAQAPALSRTWERLATLLQVMDGAGHDVIIDAGRMSADSQGQPDSGTHPAVLLRRADIVLLVVRNTQVSLGTALPAVRALHEDFAHLGTGADALHLLVIEEGTIASGHVAQVLQTPVAAALSWDPDTAAVLTHGVPRKSARVLLRSARTAHGRIGEIVGRRRVQLYPDGHLPHAFDDRRTA